MVGTIRFFFRVPLTEDRNSVVERQKVIASFGAKMRNSKALCEPIGSSTRHPAVKRHFRHEKSASDDRPNTVMTQVMVTTFG